MIEIIKYLFLGILQGVTEVLPISSSAHLLIVGQLFDISDDNMFFEIILHFASLIAILIFMRKRIVEIFGGFLKYVFKKEESQYIHFKYVVMLIISTLVVVVFTLITKDLFDYITIHIYIIGLLLIVNGIILFCFCNLKIKRKYSELNYLDALVIGAFECLGVFPGISRSGSCLCGAYARGIEKVKAADYAFLLFIPACLGALTLELFNFENISVPSSNIHLYLFGFFGSLISTYCAFKFLLKIIREKSIVIFGIYTSLLGIIVFLIGII